MNNEQSYFDQIIAPRPRAWPPRDENELRPEDHWWINHFEYLKEHGYMMRPRYRPGWKPSYDTKAVWERSRAEDGQELIHGNVMDALRMSDNLVVALKRVKATEARIATLFSDDAHRDDPRNHCVRILEVLPVSEADDMKILVMTWMRPIINPRFRTIGEGIQFFREMIEGLQYMHENNVAHRDCSINNMAMDANSMYTRPFHPVKPKKRYDWSGRALHHSRTCRPPRYFLIDFGQSRMYDPFQTGRPLEYALSSSGGYASPEGVEGYPSDPFATDVYLLGNLIRITFLDGDPDSLNEPGVSGFEFLRPLVIDMTAEDSSKRPTMKEVSARFTEIVGQLSWWTLRSRAIKNSEDSLSKPFRAINHIFWTASMLVLLKPAIPCPKPL